MNFKFQFSITFILISIFFTSNINAQSNFYDVNSGNGNGLRFWNGSEDYKISMGNSNDYKYGPVTGHSIKTQMGDNATRGFTWGAKNLVPSTALSTNGNFQTKGWVRSEIGFHMGNGNTSIRDLAGSIAVQSNQNNGSFLTFLNKLGTTYGYYGFDQGGDRFGVYHDGNLIVESIKNSHTSLGVGGNAVITALNNGSVYIGSTPAPSYYKLAVEGGIITEEVKIDVVTDWADYVFDEDYDLQSPSSVKAFIAEHSHLPNIPSAKEMEKNGLNVAKMDALLLSKIEEAFLHIIDMDEKIQSLQAENESLKSSLNNIKQ